MFGIFIPEKKNCLISGRSERIGGMFRQAAYATQLKEMRQAMVDHLAERDETFVKDGKLVVRETTMLYSPNYPQTNDSYKFFKLCML